MNTSVQAASSAPSILRTSMKRTVAPSGSGALFGGFATIARPAAQPVRQATSGAQKTYSLYDKGQQLLGLGTVPVQSVAVETPFTSIAPLAQVSGGELA